ncbi:MAG: DUF6249 domain-containing protein [Spirosomataceae bacterium]
MDHYQGMVALFIPICAIVGFFTMIIFMRYYENTEKMAMIEKGIDPKTSKSHVINPASALRLGLLAVGAGLGLFLGNLIGSYTSIDNEVAIFSFMLALGGGGLVVSWMIQLRLDEKEKQRG